MCGYMATLNMFTCRLIFHYYSEYDNISEFSTAMGYLNINQVLGALFSFDMYTVRLIYASQLGILLQFVITALWSGLFVVQTN